MKTGHDCGIGEMGWVRWGDVYGYLRRFFVEVREVWRVFLFFFLRPLRVLRSRCDVAEFCVGWEFS